MLNSTTNIRQRKVIRNFQSHYISGFDFLLLKCQKKNHTELAQQVQQLSELVQKQGQMIAKTGKQLMEMQLSDVKSRMAQMDAPQQKFNIEDYATNEDIVQLVCELQGQLDFMEDRSIARTFNSHLTEVSPES
ncbi:hypothetical protein OXX69_013172, partial [Metschnikowia pulcherrima]